MNTELKMNAAYSQDERRTIADMVVAVAAQFGYSSEEIPSSLQEAFDDMTANPARAQGKVISFEVGGYLISLHGPPIKTLH